MRLSQAMILCAHFCLNVELPLVVSTIPASMKSVHCGSHSKLRSLPKEFVPLYKKNIKIGIASFSLGPQVIVCEVTFHRGNAHIRIRQCASSLHPAADSETSAQSAELQAIRATQWSLPLISRVLQGTHADRYSPGYG